MTRDELLGTIFGLQALMMGVRLVEHQTGPIFGFSGYDLYLYQRYRRAEYRAARRRRVWDGSGWRPRRTWQSVAELL